MMKNDSTKKDYTDINTIRITAAVICAIIGLLGSFFTPFLPFAFGLALGYLFGALCFRLLALAIEKEVKMSAKNAKIHSTSQYAVRYMIKGAALYIAAIRSDMNIFGCFFGLISINIAIYALNAFTIIKDKKIKERSDQN